MGKQLARNKLCSRVYYCQMCMARHTAPTGVKCPHSANLPQKLVEDDIPGDCEQPDSSQNSQGEPRDSSNVSTDTIAHDKGSSDNNPSVSNSQSQPSGTDLILQQLAELRRERAPTILSDDDEGHEQEQSRGVNDGQSWGPSSFA